MRLTLLGRPRLFFLTTIVFASQGRPKSPRETEILRTPIQGRNRILDSHWGMFDFSDSLSTTFVFHTHLPFWLLLIRSPICFSDNFCFAPIFAFLTTFVSLNSSAETSFLQDDSYIRFPAIIRFPPIFVLHQSSFYTNLRLRIFHALVTHNLVYPELFFVPMSISTVEQTLTQ